MSSTRLADHQTVRKMKSLWASCCCISPQPSHGKHPKRIDRTMIGTPQNFKHTGHMDTETRKLREEDIFLLQVQMQSKGGYRVNKSALVKTTSRPYTDLSVSMETRERTPVTS